MLIIILLLQNYCSDCDLGLFHNIKSSLHCLHRILPPSRTRDNLRDRGHDFQPPDHYTSLRKKSFVVRILYSSV